MSDEPINILSRRLSKFFTNTDSTAFDYQRYREKEASDISLYKSDQKSFKCLCLSHRLHGSPATIGHHYDSVKLSENGIKKSKIKIWFIGDDEFMNGPNPNPYTTSDEEMKKIYISLAREAIITQKDSNISNNDLLTVERRGDDFYVIEHHGNQSSFLEKILYAENKDQSNIDIFRENKNKIKKINTSNFFPCIEKSQTTAGSCYRPAPYQIKNHGEKLSTKLTFFEFNYLSKYLDIVLLYIARHESGGDGYNANNIGEAGQSIEPKQILGKNLTEMTIEEIRGNMNDNGGILFATGKYQIIPKTLDIIYRSFSAISYLPYNEANQEAMGAFLATIKRKRLGKYLLLGEGSLEDAGNDLALEWAFSPFLKAAKYNNKIIEVGHSPYEGIAGNKTNPNRVTEAKKVLLEQRNKIINSISTDQKLKEIIEKYKGDI